VPARLEAPQWNARPASTRLGENFANLVSPLL